MTNLCAYEIAVLKECAGMDPGEKLQWGAAMGEAIESLSGGGLIRRQGGGKYVLTDKGRAHLAALTPA